MSAVSSNLPIIREMITSSGQSVGELSESKPVFLVFLRHFGCVFCKEALQDISELRTVITKKGLTLVFVHMAEPSIAEEYLKEFNLSGTIHISNPDKKYYRSFGLLKGTVSQLYGLSTWIRGFGPKTKGLKLELAEQLGDSTQMPGMFMINKNEIVKQFAHRRASQRPNYEEFISL